MKLVFVVNYKQVEDNTPTCSYLWNAL